MNQLQRFSGFFLDGVPPNEAAPLPCLSEPVRFDCLSFMRFQPSIFLLNRTRGFGRAARSVVKGAALAAFIADP
jgi:hypothetical protein